jgi:multidrug resistance efflux pump
MTSVTEQPSTQHAEQQLPERPAPAASAGGGRRMAAVRTFLVTVLLLAGAGAGGTYLVTHRLAASAFVTLDEAVLTADALPVGATAAGVVTDVLVTGQTRVAAGQELTRVRLAADPTGARKQPTTETLRAPVPGTISTVDVALGGVVGAGEPVVTLYDHTHLSFHAKATEEELKGLRLGMTASITGPGLDRPVVAALDHVEPKVGTDPLADAPLTEDQKATHEQLTVVLVPRTDNVDRVSTLVPGLRFAADIDTNTAVGRTPAVNSVG